MLLIISYPVPFLCYPLKASYSFPFQLGTKYTESMNMTYSDSEGKRKHPFMGCYGIGIGRLLACIIEENHDDFGPIWPLTVAPWEIHICVLSNKKEEIKIAAADIYNKLKVKYDVLMEERNVEMGVQFADADLLGVPIRIVIGERNLKNNEVEITTRDKSKKKCVKIEDLEEEVFNIITNLRESSCSLKFARYEY